MEIFCPVCAFSGALHEEHLARKREREPGKLHQDFERNEPKTDPHPSRWLHQACAPALGSVPGYDLLEEIGRGGMGVVFRARQICLNRIVAVKLMLPFSPPDAAARFRVEAETAANLYHPNIVAIHDAGEHAGQLYYSMDYVVGRSLAEVLQDGPLPAGRAVKYLETIARAVHYAHRKGFLHRDLKPSNILIDEFDQPRITDFGLAKRFRLHPSDEDRSVVTSGVDSMKGRLAKLDASLTLSGEVVGSPNFIAPEQAERRLSQVGPASDVFSLGAVLYHALVGWPPFQGETLAEVLDRVVHLDPFAPREIDPTLSPDLEALCLKCLAKEPGQRYGSALELADELSRIRP